MAIDFQNLVDGIEAAAALISVEVKEDGTCGELRIEAGNKGYIDGIEHPNGYQMSSNKFVRGSIYTDYVPRDLNFEDFCFRSATGKKCLHSYVHPGHMPIWFNMTFLPVGPSEGNLQYCLYTMEVNFEGNAERMSNISAELAQEVLETCIKLRGAADFHKAMDEIIVDIRELCKAENTSILLLDTYEKKMEILCDSFMEDTNIVSLRGRLNEEFYNIVLSWENLIGSSDCVIAKNEHDMEFVKEKDRVWYDSLHSSGVKNVVLFPLKNRDELLGYIWAVNFDAEMAPKIKETLGLTTFILGSEIANHMLLDRLSILSSKDMLTGVLNRNEMNNRVDTLSDFSKEAGKSVGVVFADLNGLKTINDELGHAAGDALLKDAAKALEEVFAADCIYRAGGDEFTVIQIGVTEDELKAKVAQLREVEKKYERVRFAIGYYVEDTFQQVRNALKIADRKMYDDKKMYYEAHPELKRRLQ